MRKIDVIKKPLITEKGARAQQMANQYFFAVDYRASKIDVKNAIEDFFKVRVTAVRTMTVPGKYKRVGKNVGKTSDWKKAVVTLAEGNKIDFLEGA